MCRSQSGQPGRPESVCICWIAVSDIYSNPNYCTRSLTPSTRATIRVCHSLGEDADDENHRDADTSMIEHWCALCFHLGALPHGHFLNSQKIKVHGGGG